MGGGGSNLTEGGKGYDGGKGVGKGGGGMCVCVCDRERGGKEGGTEEVRGRT